MDRTDIVRVQNDWARAARAARDIGFDLIYIFVGDRYLPMQFLSEFSNKRTDDYGVSFENRARFFLETLARVREEVDGRCAVAVRMSVEALGPAGPGMNEALQVIKAADDLVDLWHVKIGTLADMMTDAGTSRFVAENHQFALTSRVRKVTSKPIVGVGRLTDPDRMAENIRSGAWDLIGAARPSIADPFLPNKTEEGRYDEIRECIGSNECLARHTRGHLGCTQNATAGEEYRRGWHPERFTRAQNADRDVLVIGAGSAGMECAIVLGKRGFGRVHLVDANAEPGGAFRWIPRLPGLGQWGRIANWRAIQLDKQANVELISRVRLNADEVREYGAEIVVVATGSRWSEQGVCPFSHEAILGADARLAHVMTPEQIMLARGQRARGLSSTTARAISWALAWPSGWRWRAIRLPSSRRLTRSRRRVWSAMRGRLCAVGFTSWRSPCTGGRRSRRCMRTVWRRGTSLACRLSSIQRRWCYCRIGSRTTASTGTSSPTRKCWPPKRSRRSTAAAVPVGDAIFDGHRLAREIDGPNPEIPLPYKREQVFVADAAE